MSSSWIDMKTLDSKNIPELDASGLRKFAFTTAGLIAVLFALFIPWLFGFSYPTWPWLISGVLALWGAMAPATLRLLYRGWMRFGLVMHKITTPIILGVLFFLVFTPVSLLMRLIGRDPLHENIDTNASTHRTVSTVASKENMEKPF